jgi:hypothetical protein
MSEATGSALARALAKAQAVMEGASKDKTNPAFKSRYADLASVWDACRGPLTSNGLAVVQLVTAADKASVTVETRLLHESGESVSSVLTMPVDKPSAQGVGSAITYARRYALSALVGVAPDDDDDGNAASGRSILVGRGLVDAPPREAPPTPPSNVRPINAPSPWEVRINEAANIAALTAVGVELGKQPKAVFESMRALYTARHTELAARERK